MVGSMGWGNLLNVRNSVRVRPERSEEGEGEGGGREGVEERWRQRKTTDEYERERTQSVPKRR
eukprot:158025-Hanusia_phi.AAC.1